ncbi:sacsin N-terminal ATP-binding-like domain-containing protein [Paenibacillus sp. GCM10012306]|uniref:sacsin N-terminal ATP-binding-like domain-containing protein n=1 Tax=Paenibacillus sp. GCM10012306 TaxID=3317342 RepID=UPI0036075E7A
MSYNSKIKHSKEKVYSHAIATKILDLMDKLRFDENEDSSRRWIWELLQNAKDVAHDNSKLKVQIDFKEEFGDKIVEFKHRGKPFTTDNVTFLIEQVSTKERSTQENVKKKTTGKFGTGFLTTHLLSEKVEIEGILKEVDEPYRKFKIQLDRSGTNIHEIISSVNNSHRSLEGIDLQPPFDGYSPNEYNTVFRYVLDENGEQVAKKGINDLHTALTYTLIFLPEIESVKIVDENVDYELSPDIRELTDNINVYKVVKTMNGDKAETLIVVLNENDVSIAVEIEFINDRIFLKEFNPLIPRLFCDFPLVGTEDFSFPVIVNSANFNPNEPRNGIYLTDRSGGKIEENKSIILKAVKLYSVLLEHASRENWGNIHILAKIPTQNEKSWISKEWFNNEVIQPIKTKILNTPIVDTEDNKRITILRGDGTANVWFPSASSEDLRKKIWDLAYQWIPSMLPRKAHVDLWNELSWLEISKLTSNVISNSIQKRLDLASLEKMLVKGISPIDWLNSYYEILNLDQSCLNDVNNDVFSVIPNQKGIFKKKSELNIDDNIEEELKNVMELLGIDTRDYLIKCKIYTGQLKYKVKRQEDMIEEINKIIREGKREKISKACNYLVTLFSDAVDFPEKRELIYQFCKAVYPNEINEKKKIYKWSESIWKEVDKKQIGWIAQVISRTESVPALTVHLKLENDLQTLNWLDGFISYVKNNYVDFLNDSSNPILPNQKGEFITIVDLYLDAGGIDEILKKISAELGYDFRKELLDLNIFFDILPDTRVKNEQDIADQISTMLIKRLNEFPRNPDTKLLFRKLYIWFNENKEKAKKMFPEIHKNKHKLIDDEEIADNMDKAEKFDKILGKYGLKDEGALDKLLAQSKVESNLIDEKHRITEELLIQSGIFSDEGLEKAFENSSFADNFIHTSDRDAIKYNYVQKILNRSKDRIIEYLKTKKEYNLDNIIPIDKTIFLISKNDEEIYLITRPSDYGQIIIYYDTERDVLDYEKDWEIWVENGEDDPEKITFGKILKTTGINKIPLRKIR